MRKIPTTIAAIAALPLIAMALTMGRPSSADSADKSGQTAEPAQPVPTRAQVDAARRTYDAVYRDYTLGVSQEAGAIDQIHVWSQRLMEAERDRAGNAAGRSAALRAHVDRMRQFEQICVGTYHVHQGRGPQAAAAEYFRLQAELLLAKDEAESQGDAASR